MCKQEEKHKDNPLAGLGPSKIIKKAEERNKTEEFNNLVEGIYDTPKEREILDVLQNCNAIELENYQGFSEEVQDRAKGMALLDEINTYCHYVRREAYKRKIEVEGVLLPLESEQTVARAYMDMFGHGNNKFRSNGRPDYRMQGIPLMFSEDLEAGQMKIVINLGF